MTLTPHRPPVSSADATSPVPARSTHRLLDRLAAGTPFGIVFGGQGEAAWLENLADVLRRHDVELAPLLTAVDDRLAPVSDDLRRTGSTFEPLVWADRIAAGESAVDEDWPAAPSADELLMPSVAIPGVTLCQIAGLRALLGIGLDPAGAVAVAGHSQGVLAAAAVEDLPDVEVMAIARLAGVAVERVARQKGLLGATMLSVTGPTADEVAATLRDLPESARVVANVRNGRRSTVLSGPADGIARAAELFEEIATTEPVAAVAAFHHPDLDEAAELVAAWADQCGLDPVRASDLTRAAIIAPVDWVDSVDRLVQAGARWLVDLGPGDLATRLSVPEATAYGLGVVAPTTRRGFRDLTVAGDAPRPRPAWKAFRPTIVRLPDGSMRVETRFTRLTGRSPILLAGMTPTTVDPAIVAAAANAGFWAELAGGGQVTEPIFAANVNRLDALLDEGRTYAFNSLFLDPYLWRLQIGGRKLVQRARAAGSAVDAVVVTAGVPDLDDAVALVEDLRAAGIEYVVFKPGTVDQIRQVLAIADAVAGGTARDEDPSSSQGTMDVIVQIEGGKAGGHHSDEDLDQLLIETYGKLRQRDNVVVCVGGGIGTPADAARYITGSWSVDLGYPAMPLDGVLVGTAAMAALEATTSPAVKQLLVETTSDQVISGRSQLGASIHEIDNAASRTGRLLDEVAGDADAVASRRDEIVEALNRTAKPYFGDVAAMTYGQLLDRFAVLASTDGWLDVTLRDRFHELAQRAEARLHQADEGAIPTLFDGPDDVEHVAAALTQLRAAYPSVDDVILHPADVHFFIDVCRRPGKPVPFVPVIDADVRWWWRSDSLWQAHDARFDADAVCVIPGPAAVDGITQADEPIADLLRRFESAVLDAVETPSHGVDGLRRSDGIVGPVSLALAAPDVEWNGRIVRNPVRALGADWVVVNPERVEHPETGASLIALSDVTAGLAVPVGASTLRFTLRTDAAVAAGAAPVIEDADVTLGALLEAMSTGRAGGRAADGPIRWTPDLIADHAAVTSATSLRAVAVPDVLVGLTWPAVFTALGERPDVVSGILDLVHLDHSISGNVPDGETDLAVSAEVRDVADTEFGRVVTVDVTLTNGDTVVATLVERFALRGRPGDAELETPPVAGGATDDVRETPRRRRAKVSVQAPTDLRPFAAVSGDHNPIHTSLAAARVAGLGSPIVHGMWLSAVSQRAVSEETGRTLTGWTARFLAPVRPGDTVDITADRIGIVNGDEIVDVAARVDGEVVLTATGRLTPPRTAYVFPGQGIQSRGMGMEGYARSRAAREIWDRADAHTREHLGFSILEVVRDNPSELRVRRGDGDIRTFRHPDGVLFLTQFTQVAMAVLASAQVAELRESGAFVEGALTAGHSVGEYNALAAVTGTLTLEAVVEVVFQRGSVMHGLVPRDAEGRSDYRLAAIRPSQIGLEDDDVHDFVATIAFETGEFLEVANENLRGSQYVVAGTVRGCEALETEVERRRAEAGGRGAFILVPGIDVPFHSRILRGGVDSFRARLDELLPPSIDPEILVGRYVPNLVARTFSLDDDFLRSILDVVPAERIEAVLADRDAWVGREGELCRLVLVELLAWQFASPVRWIETQDLFFASPADEVNGEAGLGVERVVEVGVGAAPTLANIASSTVKLPRVARRLAGPVEVLNVERDAAAVFSTDEQPEDVDDEVVPPAEAEPEGSSEPAAPAARRASTAEPIADLPFTAGDATRLLIAWWTKVRPDQLGAADSIESLCDGASSRRNQLLVDLGAELSLGAIDGAAEADLPTLTQTVVGLARGYRPLGPVLSATVADHLKDVLGPTGVRSAAISDRVANHWSLGPGWSTHVVTLVALATRDGASTRGESLRTAELPTTSAEVDALVDSTVLSLAAERGVAVEPAGSGETLAVDAEALAAVTGDITGALVASARELLERLGDDAAVVAAPADDDAAEVLARVEAELGRDWVKATAPAFDAQRAVLLDDRWASVREDVVRIAAGQALKADFSSAAFLGAGPEVAAMARWFGLTDIAEAAAAEDPGAWADEVAVVTGASEGSIAASVVADLLHGGATVVATTSSLDATKLAFFKNLYRSNARVGAALWVVPANMASYQDVDALVDWVGTEQTRSVGPTTQVTKPALRPTLLFPFAAGRVLGDAADAGARAEVEARILLWSVERLVGARWQGVSETDRLHVVLPGSPNRGMFGGDGAYGETKAALDALVARSARESWGRRVTLAHAVIGWVRGTGLMGGNDTLVAAVEAAGVRTWTPDEMAAELLELCTPSARRNAVDQPLHADFAAGLADVDLSGLNPMSPVPEDESFDGVTIDALPPSPADLVDPARLPWGEVSLRPEDMVVIVGAGELGPYGSSRTRYQMEIADALSAAGVLELAWVTGLVRWDAAGRTWFDVESGDPMSEAAIAERYRDTVADRCGIRSYVDDGTMVDHSAPLLSSVFLDRDLTFNVASEAEAKALQAAAPEHTVIEPSSADQGDGDWIVRRKAGTEIRVPLRKPITRTVGGQIPTGFDPAAWGIPGDMVESVDRVALWNLVCTVDAFLSSGLTPAELMQAVHPARVANTQGTGMGGMTSMQSLYIDNLLGKSVPNDLLQEALPNVIAAHVVQSYVGSYGSMIHPVAACATTAVSVEEGVDKIRVGKADVVVAGGFDDLGTEGVVGFASMSATADTEAMRAQGIDDRRFSRANDRRRGGFVESQGGGTLLLARGDVALRMGLPVLGVVAYAGSFGDGIHQSIPAPGLGALAAGLGGTDSLLAKSLAAHGVTADDIAVVSKHDTSTAANDPNESDLHERLATAIGRDAGNPLLVVSQKSLTGHAKGGAAAFQLVGLCQTLVDGVVPPNRSLDCVDEALAKHRRLVWLREPLATGPLKAGLVTSLGFGHVAGLIAVVHPEAFLATLDESERGAYEAAARRRRVDGRLRIARVMLGEDGYAKPRGRRLGEKPAADVEAAVLLDAAARLGEDEVYACQ